MPRWSLDFHPTSHSVLLSPGGRVFVGEDGEPKDERTLTTVFEASGQKLAVTAAHGVGDNDTMLDRDHGVIVGSLAVNALKNRHDPHDIAIFHLREDVRIGNSEYYTQYIDSAQLGKAFTLEKGAMRATHVISVEAKPSTLLKMIGAHSSLISCPGRILGGGDSGAPLYQVQGGNRVLIGLHSGVDAHNTYFTPVGGFLQAALDRI